MASVPLSLIWIRDALPLCSAHYNLLPTYGWIFYTKIVRIFLSLQAQPSLFLPILLPKHLPVFCLFSGVTFLLHPHIAVCGIASASCSSAPFQTSYRAVISKWVLVVDAFSPSDLPMSMFAFTCHWGLHRSYLFHWSHREPGNKIKFHCLGCISLKARGKFVLRIFFYQAALQICITQNILYCLWLAGQTCQRNMAARSDAATRIISNMGITDYAPVSLCSSVWQKPEPASTGRAYRPGPRKQLPLSRLSAPFEEPFHPTTCSEPSPVLKNTQKSSGKPYKPSWCREKLCKYQQHVELQGKSPLFGYHVGS